MRRYDPGYVDLKAKLDAGVIGRAAARALRAPQPERPPVLRQRDDHHRQRRPRGRHRRAGCSGEEIVHVRRAHAARARRTRARACRTRSSCCFTTDVRRARRRRGVRHRGLRLRHPLRDRGGGRARSRCPLGRRARGFEERFDDAYRQRAAARGSPRSSAAPSPTARARGTASPRRPCAPRASMSLREGCDARVELGDAPHGRRAVAPPALGPWMTKNLLPNVLTAVAAVLVIVLGVIAITRRVTLNG